MAKYKLKAVVAPHTTVAQDDNICVGSDRTGALFIETRWKIHPFLDNDEDPEQLIYVLHPDTQWPDKQNATDKQMYADATLRVIQLRSQKVTSYIIAYRPEGTPSAKA